MDNSFVLVREFKAPKELVFKAFSTPAALNAWWGPAETKNTTISLNFKPGGMFHYKMGDASYGRFIFGQIIPYDLIEFTNAFADENGAVVKAPFDMELPDEIFYRVVFTENKGKTTIMLTGNPVGGTPEQIAGFESISLDMHKGFDSTLDKLDAYLKKA
jgi:uncharacterized protein YndB with AHSA1/START domain